MTAAMHDNRAEQRPASPAHLRPGTLVYLWAPGDYSIPGARPTLLRVERTSVHTIVGVDLRDGARAVYDVSHEHPVAERWMWEVAAPAQHNRSDIDAVERVEATRLSIDERIRLVCGSPGARLTVRLKNGDALPGVVLTRIIMGPDPDAWEAEWVVFTGAPDSMGALQHVIRADEIAGFSRDADA